MNEDKRICPYSNITLTGADSTMTHSSMSDSLGHFAFNNIKQGKYKMRISCIGYVPFFTEVSMSNSDITLPAIILKKDAYSLNDVVVTGSSFVRHNDRVLITPDKEQKKHASTGFDLLYNLMIPGLEVDSRNGTVSNAVATASLYINGQKADYIEVRGLRPKDIKKVEYIDLPNGKYAREKLVINFITTRQETGGYVSVDGSQNVGYTRGDYNAMIKLSHKNTSYTLFGGYSDNSYTDSAAKTEQIALENNLVSRETNTLENFRKTDKQYLQLNINNRTDKRTLSAKVKFVRNASPDNHSTDNIIYNNNPPVTARNRSNTISIMPAVNLYGEFDLGGNQTFDISLNGNYGSNKYSRGYTEGDYLFLTDVAEDIYTIEGETGYNIKLKHKDALGIKLSYNREISMTGYSGDYATWSHLWTEETLMTGEYSRRIGKNLSAYLQVGADVLRYRLHGERTHNFVSPYYNFMLNYNLGKGQNIYLSINRGNSSPQISYLSKVEQAVDSVQTQRGNHNLEQANYHMATLNYGLNKVKFKFSATAFWFGAIPSIGTDYFIEGDKLVRSLMSDYNYNQFKLTLSASYKVSRHLHLTAKGICTYYDRTGKFSAHQTEYDGYLGVNYYIGDFAFKAFGKTVNRGLSINPESWQMPATYGITANWNHKNWHVELGGNNLFAHRTRTKHHLLSDIYSYYTYTYNQTRQSSAYLKLAYTLDFGKKTSQEKKDIDTNINSAILKTE